MRIINLINSFIKDLKYSEYVERNGIKKDYIDLRHGYLDYSQIAAKFAKFFNKISKSGVVNYMYAQDKNLLKKISQKENIPFKNILVTAGADAALHHISETFLTVNKRALIPIPSFPRTEYHVKIVGAKPVFLNIFGLSEKEKLNRILSKLTRDKIYILFLESPSNPMGEIFNLNVLAEFLERAKNTIVVIDQSLDGYYNNSLVELILRFSNVFVIKSFSKLIGLPGLRIGYIIASERLIQYLKKTVSPYEVSTFSLEAAKEFINNQRLIAYRKKQVQSSIEYIRSNLKINFFQSKGPLILLDGKKDIVNLYSELLKQKIIVVSGENFRGLENTNTVRVSLSNFEYVKKLVKVVNSL